MSRNSALKGEQNFLPQNNSRVVIDFVGERKFGERALEKVLQISISLIALLIGCFHDLSNHHRVLLEFQQVGEDIFFKVGHMKLCAKFTYVIILSIP